MAKTKTSTSELIATATLGTSLTKGEMQTAYDAIAQAITMELKNGKNVALSHLGTMKVTARDARMGRNPRTGDPVEIAATNAVTFKAGAPLKEAVN